MIHGDDLIVTTNIGGSQAAVAACKSCSLKVSQSFIDTCSPTSGRTKKKVPTNYKWSVSCDGLIGNPQYAKQFLDALLGGTELTLQFLIVGFKVVGKAFVADWDAKGPKGSLANLSIQFEGSEGIDTDDRTWDFINGTLYTYGNFADGTLDPNGDFVSGGQTPQNNTLQQATPSES